MSKSIKSTLFNYWKMLVGSNKLKDKNRTMNAIIIITIAFLIPSTAINIMAGLKIPALLNAFLVLVGVFLYWLSRFRQKYKICFYVYSALSYITLIITFMTNAGVDGPIMFLFLLSFNLLVAVSPKRLNLLWTFLHLLIGIALTVFQHFFPSYILSEYHSSYSRLIDITLTFSISIIFLSIMTKQLRYRYDKERKTAKKRAELIEQKSLMIEYQNRQLKRIASVQSHEVRSHVATILGLSDLLDNENYGDEANKNIMEGIKQASKNLDKVINEINILTQCQ